MRRAGAYRASRLCLSAQRIHPVHAKNAGALVAALVEDMTFADALAATTGVVPISRAMEKGWLMIGYLDGSVSITKDQRLIRRFPRGTGPTLGYTDWQPGGER